MGERSLPHNAALDGVRGAAVLAVLLFHSDLMPGGFLGVDLFFVLSGYLITALLLLELESTSSVSLPGFWGRRARRLLPALFVTLVAVGLYCIVFAAPSELPTIRADGLATLAYAANWRHVVSGTSYWDLFRSPSPLQHTWSLAIEEQFYLVWPLLVLGVAHLGRSRTAGSVARRVLTLAALVAVGGAIWSLWLWSTSHAAGRIYYGTDTRAPAVAVGAMVAAWAQWRRPRVEGRRGRWLDAVGLVGAGAVGYAWATSAGHRLYTGGLLVCSVAAGLLIASVALRPTAPLGRLLSCRPLVLLGLISYGVYLLHWPIDVVLSPARTGLDRWPLFLVRLLVTLAAATASYVLVERPIRTGSAPPIRLTFAAPVVAVGVATLLVVATSGGAPASATTTPRLDAKVAAPAGEAAAGGGAGGPGPIVQPPKVDVTGLRRDAAAARRHHATRLMVVGNSVADSIAAGGLVGVPTQPGTVVANLGVPSCDFPSTRLVRDANVTQASVPLSCTRSWRAAVEAFRPDIVLLTLGDVHEQRYRIHHRWLSECSPRFAPAFDAALTDAVRTLGARGARVVFATAAYTVFLDPTAIDKVGALTDCANRLMRDFAASHPEVDLVELQQYLCSGPHTCRTEIDGAPIRPDGVHYTGPGARIVGAWILRQLGFAPPP